jgi:hypothetical protein
MVVLG